MSRRPPRETERLTAVHLINHLGRGGSERQLFLTVTHMDPTRWKNHVVVFNPSRELVYDEALKEKGVEIWPMPAEVRGIRRRLFWLTRLLRKLEAQVVHSWTVHDNAYAALAGRLAGTPVRWGSLRGSLATPALEALSRPVRLLTFRGVQRVVANCDSLGRQLEAEGIPAHRTLVLPNCVELPDPYPPPALLAELGIGEEEPLVGSIGNLRQVKNHEMFVRAMAELQPRHPEARGLIVGQPLASEPAYETKIQQEIQRLGLEEKLLLTGFRSDVTPLLRRLAVVCLTSHSEGMPNAVLEAMAAGRPVVAVRVGGVPELVQDGVTGLLVEPGDHRGMAKAVASLLDSPREAEAMGRAGRLRAEEHHSCEKAARQLSKLYLEEME